MNPKFIHHFFSVKFLRSKIILLLENLLPPLGLEIRLCTAPLREKCIMSAKHDKIIDAVG